MGLFARSVCWLSIVVAHYRISVCGQFLIFLPVFPISFLYLSISLCQRFTDVHLRFFSGVRVPCDSVTGGVCCRLFQYVSYAPPFLFIISFSIGSQVVCSRSVVLVYPV